MAKEKSPNAMELARGHTRLEQAVQRSRLMLRQRAFFFFKQRTAYELKW